MIDRDELNDRDRWIVDQFIHCARSVLGLQYIHAYWFGSRARGEGTPDSDFDVLIETRTSLSEKQRDALADIAVDLTADHGVLLDVHYYSIADLKDPRISRSPLLLSVHEEGIDL